MTYLQKLTETRKAIIEIIEPYMDKTLTRGCIVVAKDNMFNTPNLKECDRYKAFDWIGSKYDDGSAYDEIIGHYDITAVLKYIDLIKTPYQIRITLTYDNIILGSVPVNINGPINTYANIPNKPLHLYTEEEDKDLLELLKTLGPINNN